MKILCALALASATIATAAKADVVDVTFKGTVSNTNYNELPSSSYDNGIFGSFGSLSGDVYTATFAFDTAKGVRSTFSYLDQVIGGPDEGTTDPSLGGTLTINGIAVDLSGDAQGYLSVAFGSEAGATIGDSDGNLLDESIQDAKVPYSIDASFYSSGSVSPYYENDEFFISRGDDYAYGDLAPTTVQFLDVSAAPEPSVWALMMAGILGIGLVLRSRKRISALTT